MANICTRITLSDELSRLVKNQDDALTALIKRYDDDAKRTEATFRFVQEAQAEGLILPTPRWYGDASSPCYEVENMLDFRTVHKLLGKLVADGNAPADDDARKRLVWCYMRPVDESSQHIRFKYKRRLPKGSKCQVKRLRMKGSTYTTVVCAA
jgi:hypothetical protein